MLFRSEIRINPGEKLAVQPGESISVPDSAGVSGIRVERAGNDLVVVYPEGRVTLENFFAAVAAPVPNAPALRSAAGQGAASTGDDAPTFAFADAEGLHQISPAGSAVHSGNSLPIESEGTRLPEHYTQPEATPPSPRPQAGGGTNFVVSGSGGTQNQNAEPDFNQPEALGLGSPHFSISSVQSIEGGLLVFTVTRSGGRGALTSLFPRGGASNYTLVLVDGVRVNSFGGAFDFAHLSVANIDRIEVVRGPQSALYGSEAIGAVVQVFTRTGGAPTLNGQIEAGSQAKIGRAHD